MKLSIKIVFWVLILIVCFSCRQKTSPVGYEGSYFKNGETDNIQIETIFSLIDTTYIAPFHSKLIVGKINNTESRVLLQFTNLISDTLSIVENPKITLYIKNANIGDSLTVYYAPIIGSKFTENISIHSDYPSWIKPNSEDTWATPGGDYSPIQQDTLIILKNKTEVSFTLDKEIVSLWAISPEDNFGLILYTDNQEDKYIEFHSRHINTYVIGPKTPKIAIKYAQGDTSIITAERNVTEDAFIYNSSIDSAWNENELYISNIPPRSLYLRFNVTPDCFDEKQVKTDEDIQKLNIIQATLIFTIDDLNSVISDSTYSFTVSIPDSILINNGDKYDRTSIGYPVTPVMNDITTENELHINIRTQLEYIITKQKENYGVVLVNNIINEDFNYIRIFGSENNIKRPRIHIKYSIFDKDI